MSAPVVTPVVIFACGNPSRGDDALGPLLLDRLRPWLRAEGLADAVELVEDFQLQIEHALDLEGRRLALFIDAGHGTPAPFHYYRAEPDDSPGHSTHALSPEAVLAVYRRINGSAPPPAYVLCVRGERFELGEGLSAAAGENLDAAWARLREFCREREQI